MSSNIHPTFALKQHLWKFYLDAKQPIEGPYITIKKGWGLHAQNLEGQILKDVMLGGIKKDIVCLPVHDAIAVQQQQDWVKKVMLETWQAHLKGVGTKVKVDLP